ncbi:hypothetical protein [Kitasatospora sp. NPDC088351]|uniref:hypothetical protein n=1 Tax=unclassified Kitasatospora TaxID=2633591 RepID=UPI003413DD38
MATPPPPPPLPGQSGPGFAGFPQQHPPQHPQQFPPATAVPGFGPPPGLPASPGLPPAPGSGGPGRRAGNLRRNAVWAFVGALLASAGWAGAVAVVPRMVTSGSFPQSVRGYHTVDKLCDAGKLTKFNQNYRMVDNYPLQHSSRSDSMDIMRCYALMKRTVSGSDSPDYATIDMRAELHKAVDAAPEFAATRIFFEQQKYEITDVRNLGQEAYFAYGDEPTSSDKTFHDINCYLEVRDGGMTYSLYWTDNYQTGKDYTLDRDTVRQIMIADSRDVLKAIGGP